ncbi:MAG: hypothetical protein JWO12_985 [Frankiales bacterium]|nr:hypothetical protein [Frankiales bacterium]
MNPLATRSRVEELARLLEGAVSGPRTMTAGHAALATRLRAVAPALEPKAAPRTEFRSALRTRLVAVATVQAATIVDTPAPAGRALDSAVTWTQTRTAQRRIGATAGAMASVIALTGVGIAASHSLPGAPFYALKLKAEDVQLSFTSGDTARGSKHLEFAGTRLREVAALAHGDGQLSLGAPNGLPVASGLALSSDVQQRINDTLAAFNSETKSGRALLEHAYRTTGKSEPLRILASFSSDEQSALVTILPDLPEASKPHAEQSLQLVTDVGSSANQLLSIGTCGGSCFPQAAGPTLPSEPAPTPGATASPTGDTDSNNVPACTCVAPQATPEPTPASEPTPAETPSTEPTPTGSPSPSPSASQTPEGVPVPVVPTILPSVAPTTVPLPAPVPTSLPTLPPVLSGLLPAPTPKS